MKKAILLLPRDSRDSIYSAEQVAEIGKLVELTDCCDRVGKLDELRPVLAETEIILSGWGMMPLEDEFLAAAPRLRAVLYGAGSVRGFVTEEFWRRDILLTSTYAANAVPVIEYTLAAIVFGLKRFLQAAALTREERTFRVPPGVKGLYGAKVGIIGAGMVGGGVLRRLNDYHVETFCTDPYLSEERARELGTRRIDLAEMFRICDVVSLHAASIPSTAGMITGRHFRSMKEGAVFINTARGQIVREGEMIDVLREGGMFAFIDVTDPEPPERSSILYDLPNVFLTPHLAGSAGDEVHRQGDDVLEELRRFLSGKPPRYPVTRDMMEWMA
jgi:phosphoglycerate dehydrogenase-like enzyme